MQAAPLGKRIEYWDTSSNGLMLRVTDSGQKTFYYKRTYRGHTRKRKIATLSTCSIENARKQVDKLNGMLANGDNPFALQRIDKLDLTYEELFSRYINEYAKLHTKTWQDTIDNHVRYFRPLSKILVSQLTREQVEQWFHSLSSTNGKYPPGGKYSHGRPYTANRQLDTLRAVINWGLANHLIECDKAFLLVKRNRQRPRRRYLRAEEFEPFISAVLEEPNDTIRDFILMCLYTGARSGNVMTMRWDDIDKASCLWHIPDSKNGEQLAIALVEEAIKLLEVRGICKQSNVYVFPGRYKKDSPLAEPKGAWKRILAKAGISDFRIHDLRHTMGSYMAMSGSNMRLIGDALGHKSLAATNVYTTLGKSVVRTAMQTALATIRNHSQQIKTS